MQLTLDLNKKSRLLIIDDEPMMQNLYRAMFETENFDCDHAMSGREALDLVSQNKAYDLVLLDIMMPEMSGHEVCRILREDYLPSELPIIAVTAKEGDEDLIKGFSLGVNDYLKKPFTLLELMTRIKAQINLLDINRSLQRFVPREFIRELGRDSITTINLGDQVEGEMTVLFADIRRFTEISETLTPQDTFRFLNLYLRELTPIIRRYNGFVDKFVGDAIMALFPGDPDDAVKAAQMMIAAASHIELPPSIKALAPIQIGIGLHTGPVMLGTIGDELRMDVTVISDAVNLASRLELLTKERHCSIAMSAVTHDKCHHLNGTQLTHLEQVSLKGMEKKVSIYCM